MTRQTPGRTGLAPDDGTPLRCQRCDCSSRKVLTPHGRPFRSVFYDRFAAAAVMSRYRPVETRFMNRALNVSLVWSVIRMTEAVTDGRNARRRLLKQTDERERCWCWCVDQASVFVSVQKTRLPPLSSSRLELARISPRSGCHLP